MTQLNITMSLNYDKIIVFGDSITQFSNQDAFGLQPALQNLYQRKLDVINRGFSGYSSRHGTYILPKILAGELNQKEDNVKLITIFFGTNDATLLQDELADLQRVPIEEYEKNIDQLVRLSLEAGAKVILISPGLHDGALSKDPERPANTDWLSNEHILKYVEAGERISKKHDVGFVNLWDAFRIYGGWSKEQVLESTSKSDKHISFAELVDDGIHFTGKAYEILFNEVVKVIDGKFPELKADSLPLRLLYWRDLVGKDSTYVFENEKELKKELL